MIYMLRILDQVPKIRYASIAKRNKGKKQQKQINYKINHCSE